MAGRLLALVCLLLASRAAAQSDHRRQFALDAYDTVVGSYALAPDHHVVVGLAWGGDLTYRDTVTGAFGTLTPAGDDAYADEAGRTVRFLRDAAGAVEAVQWPEDEGSGDGRRAERLALRFEPVAVPSGEAVLAGTLVLPPGPPPHPTVILSGGASWIVREQLLDDALTYAASGVAALIYDKRGWGASTGDQTVPFQTLADDLVALVDHLRTERMDLHPKQIGLSTYSQSGWYGTLAAARTDAVAFLILNVAPATTVYRQEFQRVEHELRADGFAEAEIADALALMQRMSRFSRTGEGWDAYAAARTEAAEAPWFRYLFAPASPDPAHWRWGRMNWEYNPLPALTRITAPTLVVLGEHDRKVLPEVNRSIFEAALDAAGNRDAEIVIVPGMNHSLVASERGGRTEDTPNRLAPGLLALRRAWLAARF